MKKRTHLLLILIIFSIQSCQSIKGKDVPIRVSSEALDIRMAAILPFIKAQRDPVFSDLVSCPLTGYRTKAGMIEKGAEDKVYHALRNSLEKTGVHFTSELSMLHALNEVREPYSREGLTRIASLLGVDTLIGGCVLRFEERVGMSYGAERGASVAFSVAIWRFPQSVIVWSSYFDETQVPLSENLLKLPIFLRGRSRWVTADELLHQGVSQLVESMPIQKK